VENNRLHINDFLSHAQDSILIDVRSPSEFKHAHIPGSLNLPLFSDEERKIVGTAYKQISREEAIKIGLEYFGPKMRKMVEQVENFTKEIAGTNTIKKTKILIYCWRGGMRSAAIGWLLQLYGYNVFLLANGYKSFRNYVLKTFTYDFPFKVVGGFTGSGKTEIIKELIKKGKHVIDLEEIAQHKGSAFGNLKMHPQPSQEMFENLLAWELLPMIHAGACEIWVEDESQRIGNLNIPMDLWKQMRTAPVLFLDIPFEKRLQHITEEYGTQEAENILNSIERISKRLGGADTKKASEYLKTGNLQECFAILLKYYDKYYLRGLHNRDNLTTLLHTIPCEYISPGNIKYILSIHSVL
jgi:tRNA 2-selenouridine synthase